MRVVLTVQFGVVRHVSRTNTWRSPLFGAVAAELDAFAVTARKAMYRPVVLIEGRIASVPASCPP